MIHGVDEQFIVNRVPVKFFASVVADKNVFPGTLATR